MSVDEFRSRRFTPVAPADRPRRQRRATRVVITDGESVLLFADTDPGIPGSSWWVTPGGGIDPGETELDAGVRELAEETGLVVAASDLVGPLMRRTVVHGYSDQVLTQEETFYLLRTPKFVPDTTGHTPAEKLTLGEQRWVKLTDLSALPDPVWPDELPMIVARAIEPETGVLDLGFVEESTLAADA